MYPKIIKISTGSLTTATQSLTSLSVKFNRAFGSGCWSGICSTAPLAIPGIILAGPWLLGFASAKEFGGCGVDGVAGVGVGGFAFSTSDAGVGGTLAIEFFFVGFLNVR